MAAKEAMSHSLGAPSSTTFGKDTWQRWQRRGGRSSGGKYETSGGLGAQPLGGTVGAEIGRRIRTGRRIPLRGTAVVEIGMQLQPLMANSEKLQTLSLRTTTTRIKAISHRQGKMKGKGGAVVTIWRHSSEALLK